MIIIGASALPALPFVLLEQSSSTMQWPLAHMKGCGMKTSTRKATATATMMASTVEKTSSTWMNLFRFLHLSIHDNPSAAPNGFTLMYLVLERTCTSLPDAHTNLTSPFIHSPLLLLHHSTFITTLVPVVQSKSLPVNVGSSANPHISTHHTVTYGVPAVPPSSVLRSVQVTTRRDHGPRLIASLVASNCVWKAAIVGVNRSALLCSALHCDFARPHTTHY